MPQFWGHCCCSHSLQHLCKRSLIDRTNDNPSKIYNMRSMETHSLQWIWLCFWSSTRINCYCMTYSICIMMMSQLQQRNNCTKMKREDGGERSVTLFRCCKLSQHCEWHTTCQLTEKSKNYSTHGKLPDSLLSLCGTPQILPGRTSMLTHSHTHTLHATHFLTLSLA